MTNTQKFAKRELDILAATVPDAIVIPFKEEILALCEAFGNSGQSGGSAPYAASAIAKAIKKLLLQEPICDVTGHESEWKDMTEWFYEATYQNKRCSALFRIGIDGRAYYLNAIVWKGTEDYDTFTGRVYLDNINFYEISSHQYVRFPFKPKTFYIDVIRVMITEEEAKRQKIHYSKEKKGSCYYTLVKDTTQLQKVFKYYEKCINSNHAADSQHCEYETESKPHHSDQ